MQWDSSINRNNYFVILFTYVVDLMGYSIVFPILAPLLLGTEYSFFGFDASLTFKTTMLGLLYSVFGIGQMFSTPFINYLSSLIGRFWVLIFCSFISFCGYILMAYTVFEEHLPLLFFGRLLTGLASGTILLSQSAVHDLTNSSNRDQGFQILNTAGALAFMLGPWIGGKLSNFAWIYGSGGLFFAATISLINFFLIVFFYRESFHAKSQTGNFGFFQFFIELKTILHNAPLLKLFSVFIFFALGWSIFLIFSPAMLVQHFQMLPDIIGDFYAYFSVLWAFTILFLVKFLSEERWTRPLTFLGFLLAIIGMALFAHNEVIWYFWWIIPFVIIGSALAWAMIGKLTQFFCHSEDAEVGIHGLNFIWTSAQILGPILVGPLAGLHSKLPISLGAVFILTAFFFYSVLLRNEDHG
jgi:DHA1 family tetracycline resistance protein-like MFS transporter